MSDIYFDSKMLPKEKFEYVAFIDLMGIQKRMELSVHQSANFIFKLHSALLSAKHRCCNGRIALYPIMDGAYISTPQYKDMEEYLARVFSSLANSVSQKPIEHVFIPRAGVAYGGVIHGYNVPYEASLIFEREVGYKEKIMLGPAMISAYLAEKEAAPFGIHVDDSAVRSGNNTSSFPQDWRWHSSEVIELGASIRDFRDCLLDYFDKVNDPTSQYGYDSEKFQKHTDGVKKYFSES